MAFSQPPLPNRSKSVSYRARRIHRWLGLIIGVQFVLWTIGGLYFSWTDLDEIHGDHLMRSRAHVPASAALVSPAAVIEGIRATTPVDSITGIELTSVLGRPTWRVSYLSLEGGRAERHRQLADATTGALRGPLSREEAVTAATAAYAGKAPMTSVEYLTAGNVGRHHEYRAQPLPAWAVHFGDEEGATAYVPAELGQVLRIRNDRWRVFDFLWMLHTMDYEGRDDFNNVLLRAFSVFGLLTVLSGFVLFVLTSRPVLNRRQARLERQSASPSSSTAAPLAGHGD
jgi:uncharacterized iron-regulated membrane protein